MNKTRFALRPPSRARAPLTDTRAAARPPLRRFFGLHFDLHAHDKDRELGKQVTPGLVERIIRTARPDFIQYDCKGHGGFLAYPNSKVSATAGGADGQGMIKDSIAIYRDVTRRHGVDLYMHFSGVWDDQALREHPEWVTRDPQGAPQARATSTFGPYVRERMIPQMLEIIDRYQVDGFWVDGDCWAVQADYCPAAIARFRQRTGLEAVPTKPGEPGWLEWTALHREQFVAYLHAYLEAVHAAAPATRIASNWFHSRLCPMPAGVAPVDYISGDYSPYNAVDTARFDARQMASVGLPWDLMAWGFCSVPGAGTTHKSALQLCQEAAQVLAQGGGFQFYYCPDRDGGFSEFQLRTMGEVARFCRRRQASCHPSQTVPQVAVLLDTRSLWSASPSVARTWSGEYRCFQGLLQPCIEAGHSVDIIADQQLAERLAEYSVLVVPEWLDMADDTVQRITQFVKKGGSLLVSGAKTAARFGEIVGATLEGEPVEASATVHVARPLTTAACNGLWQTVVPHPGTRVLATRTVAFNQERAPVPAATLARYGRGRVAAVYGPLGAAVFNSHAPGLRQVVATALAALYRPLATLRPGNHGKVDLVLRRRRRALVVHLLNVNNMPTAECTPTQDGNAVASGGNYPFVDAIPEVGPLTIEVRGVPGPRRATLQPGGQPLEVGTCAGGFTVTVPRLHVHAAIVLDGCGV